MAGDSQPAPGDRGSEARAASSQPPEDAGAAQASEPAHAAAGSPPEAAPPAAAGSPPEPAPPAAAGRPPEPAEPVAGAAVPAGAPESEPAAPPRPPAAPVHLAAPADPVPRWLRSGAAIAWRLLALAAAIALTAYALAYLRVVVLPVIVALLVSTVLGPPARWLTRHRFSNGAAAATVVLSAIVLLAGALALAGAAVGRQFADLADSIQDGIREAGDALARPPFNLSKTDIHQRIDDAIGQLSDSSGALTGGALHGAVLVGELLTGLIITLLLLFFFLKDGPGIWRWVVDTFGGRQRARLDELARRSYHALAGYVRGLALVGVADAALIGTGLLIIGVPLVGPLMLLTFLAAFLPLIGAFSAGLASVLIALVSGGVVKALLVLALIVAVQQVEGHLLYPLIMGRTINVHPIAIIVGLATGGILAGIIGVFISVPIVTVAATALSYLRETREQPDYAATPHA
jgi:predicted PurR-regulated permease PerM